MLGRLICAPLHAVRRGPAVRFDVAGEAAVEARHGARLRDPEAAFAPSPAPGFERSRGFETRLGRVSWLRAPAPVPLAEGDGLRARVYEPARPRATVILAHGVGMEPEMWRGLAEPPAPLIEAGCRVIQPEAPWHGHRALPGMYGGEPVFAGGPIALIDFTHAAVLKLGHLIAWAKAFGDEPVALAGVSLGALTAQRLATAARAWPDSMRPDALFLVTASASIGAVGFSGSLPSALGVPEALGEAGWTRAEAERWAPLLEPSGAPAIPSERIVMLLGDADDVVPFREGLALAAAWAVPRGQPLHPPAGPLHDRSRPQDRRRALPPAARPARRPGGHGCAGARPNRLRPRRACSKSAGAVIGSAADRSSGPVVQLVRTHRS